MRFELNGPLKFIKKTGEIKDLKHSDIENATLQLKSTNYNLLQNNIKFSYHKDRNDIFVYHMYSYLKKDGEKDFGRWYFWFKKLPITKNKFVYKIKEYEDEYGKIIGPATITINFTDKSTEKIQKLIDKLH